MKGTSPYQIPTQSTSSNSAATKLFFYSVLVGLLFGSIGFLACGGDSSSTYFGPYLRLRMWLLAEDDPYRMISHKWNIPVLLSIWAAFMAGTATICFCRGLPLVRKKK